MKKVWTVCYQLPGRTKTKSFDSFEEAKLFARRLISKHSEIPEYLDDVRDGRRKKYRAAIAKKQYASFLRSQNFTASRIPAQTLQSFMQMHCVGFTGTATNQCFVSHWQTWLQGSDY